MDLLRERRDHFGREAPKRIARDGCLFVERDLYLAGDAEAIADRLAHVAETLDAEEISFDLAFENMGITGEEADAQLEAFADRVAPYLEEEFPSVGDG